MDLALPPLDPSVVAALSRVTTIALTTVLALATTGASRGGPEAWMRAQPS